MKHFIIDIQYTVPFEVVSQVVDRHRQFLQTGYDKGWLLLSGPKETHTGGMVVARAPSLKDLQDSSPRILIKSRTTPSTPLWSSTP